MLNFILGVLLGSLLTLNVSEINKNYHNIENATLQGLAAGTILYVTFFEVLDRERKKDTAPGLLKLLFTVVGFFFMVMLEIIGKYQIHLITFNYIVFFQTLCKFYLQVTIIMNLTTNTTPTAQH